MERDKILRILEAIEAQDNLPVSKRSAKNELLAEYDRLKLRVASLAADLWDANAALDEAQSWLGTISKPATNGMSDLPGLIGLWNRVQDYLDPQKPSEKPQWFEETSSTSECTAKPESTLHKCILHGNYWARGLEGCPMCNPLPCTDKLPENMFSTDDGIYHVSRRGTKHFCSVQDCDFCKPTPHTHTPPTGATGEPKCEHKNLGTLALGGTQRCLDCHEWLIAKPLAQCPECGGTRQKIVRYDFSGTWAILYERCPRCRGEGVI